MTSEQRFEKIETDLAITTATLRTLAEVQHRQSEAQQRLTATISQLTETVSLYVDIADQRMKRIEENLDGLIRAIAADHGNGKGRKPE